jgi:AAA ATPase domain/AAA domain
LPARGAGKTCLLREVARGAVAYGLRVLEGDCQRRTGEPYAPIPGALLGYARGQQPAELRKDLRGCAWLARILPDLLEDLDEPLPAWPVAPEQEQRLIHDAVARFLTAIAGPAGTLLVLDNLQWAGTNALDLLATLARSSDRRILVIGAYRDSELGPHDPPAIAIADLTGAGLVALHTLPPLHAAPPHPGVPRAPASPAAALIGRDQDQIAVANLLRHEGVRLLTLTGPGGIGKTRLALHVVEGLADLAAGEVFFVALAPLRDPALVAATIAEAVGLKESPGRPAIESLAEFMRGKQALLLLDNFEHLLQAAGAIATLLAACPDLTVLVTSRAALRVPAEHEFPVPPLAWPAMARRLPVEAVRDYPAMELFARSAIAAKPDFRVTTENVDSIAAICARLDGLPLAIELAAARIKILPPGRCCHGLWERITTLRCACCPEERGIYRCVCKQCAMPLPGATICWMRARARYSGGWRCSPAAVR